MFNEPIEQVSSANTGAIILTPVDLTLFTAEYVSRVPDLIIHIGRKGELLWRRRDAQLIWDAMVETFRLQDREDRLRVEFVPEAYGWCVIVFGVAAIMPPSDKMIMNSLLRFEEMYHASLDS